MEDSKHARVNHQSAKLEEVNELLGSLKLNRGVCTKVIRRESIKVKLSDAKAGWHGMKKSPPKLTPADAKKKSAKPRTTPSRGQSLMLDFINCTPKGKLAIGCSSNRD